MMAQEGMQGMPGGGFAAMGVFFLLWLLVMAGFVVGWVVFLVAVWRGMKAHERIASTLDSLASSVSGRSWASKPEKE